jgi:hypothetical protein
MRTSTEPVAELPTRSVAVEVLVAMPFEVSWLEAGDGPVATPEPASVAVQVRSVLALFQPFPLAAGLRDGVTTGPVLSDVYDGVALTDVPVQPFPLKLRDAATVYVCTSSPVAPVPEKVQVPFGVDDVVDPAKPAGTPLMHVVSLGAVTVRVRAAPDLAYRTPPTVAVPLALLVKAAVTALPAACAGADVRVTRAGARTVARDSRPAVSRRVRDGRAGAPDAGWDKRSPR